MKRFKLCGKISFVVLVVSFLVTLLLFNAILYVMFLTNAGMLLLTLLFNRFRINNVGSLGSIHRKLDTIYNLSGKFASQLTSLLCVQCFDINTFLANKCDERAVYFPHTDQCYKVDASKSSWSDARIKCQEIGGDLASITDSATTCYRFCV